MSQQCVFVNTEKDAITTKILSFYVEERPSFQTIRNLDLIAVEELTYPHPEAPEHATVSIIRPRLIISVGQQHPAYPATYNLWISQNGIKSITQHLPEL